MNEVNVDSRQNVGNVHNHNVEFGQQLYFAPGNTWIVTQFASDRYEVFLENLHRNHTCP